MTVRKPLVLVDGEIEQLPSGDTIGTSDTIGFFPGVEDGETKTVPEGHQFLCARELVVEGELILDGDIYVL